MLLTSRVRQLLDRLDRQTVPAGRYGTPVSTHHSPSTSTRGSTPDSTSDSTQDSTNDSTRDSTSDSTQDQGLWTPDSRLTTLFDALISALLAPACAVCDGLLEHPTKGPVCADCWASIRPLTPPLCDACGDPLPSWRTASVPVARCPRCRRSRRAVDCARAIGPYEGALRGIIHALKYDGRRSLASPLGALMRARAGDLLDGIDAVVPVPLHRSRRRQRGFNQAADLARALGLPIVHALRRLRATPTQTSLPAARRHRNVRGAFATRRRAAALEGRVVLLVDDVCTTGATLEACAAALKAAGVREVRALTAARVVSSPR